MAHEVAARDVRVHAAGRPDAVHRAREVRAAGHQPPRHDPLAHDLARVVDVVDEVVERADALREAALDLAPLRAAEHARHEVQRERPFVARLPLSPLVSNVIALLHEHRVAAAARLDQAVGAEPLQLPHQRHRHGARLAVELEQLVQEGRPGPVVECRGRAQRGAHRGILPRGGGPGLRRMEQVEGSRLLTCRNSSPKDSGQPADDGSDPGCVPGTAHTDGSRAAHGGPAPPRSHPYVPMPLIDTTQMALESAMRGAWARQTLLTNNIANANTPGYRREDLNFHTALRTALVDGESPAAVPFQPEVSSQVVGPEGNGVNIDQEASLLSSNGLEYEALVQVMGAREGILRSAMGVN